MIVALLDNGSLEPAAHIHLREVADAISKEAGTPVHAVSWKHSDRIAESQLDGTPAWTLAAFVRAMHALGQREFVFVPFFVSPQGAIGSALHSDLETLRNELGGFEFRFTPGLAALGVLASIVADRVREKIIATSLRRPPVLLVDHGGPSPVSAALRDDIARQVSTILGMEVGSVAAASMEGVHSPLLAEHLETSSWRETQIVVGLLFLSPGRHAGPNGDVARICAASTARCHLTDLVGSHPLTSKTLAAALRETLASVHDSSLLPAGSSPAHLVSNS